MEIGFVFVFIINKLLQTDETTSSSNYNVVATSSNNMWLLFINRKCESLITIWKNYNLRKKKQKNIDEEDMKYNMNMNNRKNDEKKQFSIGTQRNKYFTMHSHYFYANSNIGMNSRNRFMDS